MMVMMKQQKRKPVNRRRDHAHGNSSNMRGPGGNQHKHHNTTANKTTKPSKPQAITISSVTEFPEPVIYGTLDYPLPTPCPKPKDVHVITEKLPSFEARPAAILKSTGKLTSTFNVNDMEMKEIRQQTDSHDPALAIVSLHRANAKTLKLGNVEIDIYKKPSMTAISGSLHGKLVNKFLQKDGLATTPLKRNRDEVVEVSSSLKKNKRMQELQADTTMELSFEGKAMDKSDIVKLVDSSGIMQDETHIPGMDTMNTSIDTRNILQSSDFNFEFKRQ